MLRASWVIEPAAPVLLVWVCSGTFLFSPVFLMFVALPPAWLSQRVSEGVSWGRDSLQGLPSSAVTGGLVGFPLAAGCVWPWGACCGKDSGSVWSRDLAAPAPCAAAEAATALSYTNKLWVH